MKNEKPNKERLDSYLVERGWFETKSQALAAVMCGNVKVNGVVVTKAGTQIKPEPPPEIEVKSIPYVSRGGFKLEKAIKTFAINVKNRICLDAGASTGGFTDFLLQNNAAKVYAVDVGYGQLAWKLRQDSKVKVIERVNIRNVPASKVYDDADDTTYADFACADLSFISLTKVLENIKTLMNKDSYELVLLIKPQFEAGKEQVPKSGVVKDKNIHIEVISRIVDFAENMELFTHNLTFSPITGPAGNIEYLIHLKNIPVCDKIETKTDITKLVSKVVNDAHEQLNKD